MKKTLRIIGAIIGLIIVAVLCIAFIQKDNIAAFITALRNNPEQIMTRISENDQTLKGELESHLSDTYRDYTNEEKAQIESGEVSEKEVLAKIVAEKSAPALYDDTVYGPPAPERAQQTKSADEIINRYVSALYSMEGRYIGSIEGVIARAHSEYVSIAKHNNDTAAMASVGSKYIGEIYALESSCDSEVNTLLSNLKSELSAIGADTSVIGTIRSAYSNEKQLKRSYYMGKYMN